MPPKFHVRCPEAIAARWGTPGMNPVYICTDEGLGDPGSLAKLVWR